MTDVTVRPGGLAVTELLKRLFIALGILPFVLVATIIFFAAIEPRFLTPDNIFNVTRQSTYLVVLAMAHMIVLITGNFDLSIGSNVALGSVITTLVSTAILKTSPDAAVWAVTLGCIAAIGIGIAIGVLNGVGVAIFGVNSFIMTLGMMSMAFGLGLTITGGLPISGLPRAFGEVFTYSRPLGIPAPVVFTAGIFVVLYLIVNWTRLGRYWYALGSNARAARLSGINVKLQLILAHTACAVVAALGGILMTARTGVGDATMGENLPLMSITACVIAGVSLFGGIGRIGSVVFGGFFITLLGNGMNLIEVSGYVQVIVIGAVLVLAVAADQLRLRFVGQLRRD